MKRLLIILSLTIVITSCSSFTLRKDNNGHTPTPGLDSTALLSDNHLNEAPVTPLIQEHRSQLFILAGLLSLWLIYRCRPILSPARRIELDAEDKALLGLTVDTLGDLWHRLQAKTRAKIITFPRGN